MLNRIAGIVGWIGTGLVAGAVAIRLFKPEFAYVRLLAGVGRPGLRGLLHARAMARRRQGNGQEADAAQHDRARRRAHRVGPAHRRQLPGISEKPPLGSHREPAVQSLAADAADPREAGCAGQRAGLRSPHRVRSVSRSAERVPVRLQQGRRRIPRSGQAAGSRDPEPGAGVRHRRLRLQRPHRARHLVRRAGADQRADQSDHRIGAKGLFPPGARREGNGGQRARGLQRRRDGAGIRELQGRDAVAGAAADGAGRRHGGCRRRTEDGPFSA